ncbi:hypothetical protein BFP70_05055 [Thioclava sp. SK-1]|nr:hypothetical protein BFP70_05055 [Thioclava sp. SK-1]
MTEMTFLSLDFAVADHDVWRSRLLDGHDGFRYLVTPNVDHVVRLSRDPAIAPAYQAATWRMCDSRILERLAKMRGMALKTYPGASLVRDLLEDPRSRDLTIAIVGPDTAHFDILCQRFTGHRFIHVEAPFMAPGAPEWEATLHATEAAQADLILLCLSFPKQEYFAHDLQQRGHARGTALCVGASIDFLTGHQARAPEWVQRAGMEWAFRLLSNPRRLWKRYLIDGPKVFALYLADGRR